jgi:hypothetical protein
MTNSLGLEKWEQAIADKYPTIEFDDEKIYQENLALRWIYDKAYISREFNDTHAYNFEEYVKNARSMPDYPFVIKPQVNTMGMGRGTVIMKTPCDWLKYRAKNKLPNEPLIILPYYQGAHLSIDMRVTKGRVDFSCGFLAIKDNNDSFVLFASVMADYSYISKSITNKLAIFAKRVPDGFYCLEFISDKLIDAHARPSLQFIDMHRFYRNNSNMFSRVYRLPYNAIITAPNGLDLEFEDNVQVFTCFEEGVPLSNSTNDSYSYRYLIINGFDLLSIERASERVHSLLKIKKV